MNVEISDCLATNRVLPTPAALSLRLGLLLPFHNLPGSWQAIQEYHRRNAGELKGLVKQIYQTARLRVVLVIRDTVNVLLATHQEASQQYVLHGLQTESFGEFCALRRLVSLVKEQLGVAVSIQTIQRILGRVDWLQYTKMDNTLALTPAHKEARLT
ncbi:hypothetical protein PHMEG_00014317 [Phytophthora megakarya]|uniref:Uncharacterized protein n=1 Tax=Phytophthora megakarya TaxID=4795 RepID=A0A225W5R3_9STRA|nr:hypothetical protein PHMEG_00014317 [Phytophthora megakarya]